MSKNILKNWASIRPAEIDEQVKIKIEKALMLWNRRAVLASNKIPDIKKAIEYVAGNEGYSAFPTKDITGYVIGFGQNISELATYFQPWDETKFGNNNYSNWPNTDMDLSKTFFNTIKKFLIESMTLSLYGDEDGALRTIDIAIDILVISVLNFYFVSRKEKYLDNLPIEVSIDLAYNLGFSNLLKFSQFKKELAKGNKFMAALNLLFKKVDIHNVDTFTEKNATPYLLQTKSRAIRNARLISEDAVNFAIEASEITNFQSLWIGHNMEAIEMINEKYSSLLAGFLDEKEKGKVKGIVNEK